MRGLRLFAVAVALAGLVAFVVATLLEDPSSGTVASRPVVLAAVEIGAGELLRADQLSGSTWSDPKNAPPADAVASPDDVVGRSARRQLAAGRLLRDSDFYPRADPLALAIGIGMRAYVVRINDFSQAVGFGGPGSVVDVMLSATRNVPQPFSRMILSGVRVLAVRPEAGASDSKAPNPASLVTFELTPEQVETLDLGRTVGELSIVSRNPADPANAISASLSVLELARALQPGGASGPSIAQPAPQQAPVTPSMAVEPPPRVVYLPRPAEPSTESIPPAAAPPAPALPPPVQEIRGGSLMIRKAEP